MALTPNPPHPPRRRSGPAAPLAPALWVLIGSVLGACAARPGVVFDPANTAHRWPLPPDEPRIAFVGELRADRDLKPGRGLGQGLGALLFGKPDARTMLSPLGVCTDGAERVFVADSNAQVVHVFDLRTRRYARWLPPPKVARFSQPVAVAYDPVGRLLVADSVGSVIFVFDAQGKYLGTLGDGRLGRPCGLAVDAAGGRVFIADPATHEVVVLTRDDAELARIGGRGGGPGEFNYPTNVALDGRGRLYVSDSLNFRIQVFDADLRPLRQFGRKGDMPGYFSQPKGIAVDAGGHLYVVDSNFEAVQVFDSEGNLLMAFGHEGNGPGEFWLPVGIHAGPDGRIWVADSYNRRVQVFQYLEEGAP